MFPCKQRHQHDTAAQRDGCDAKRHDLMSLLKMSQIGFAGPAKIRRVYEPGRVERRSGLELVVFSEEQIVPWNLEDPAKEE
jgi:hypothetical protein